MVVDPAAFERLRVRLQERRAHVVVQGVGYVGLPLSLALLRAGYLVVGLDCDPGKVAALKAGTTSCQDVDSSELADFVERGRFVVTTEESALAQADVVVVCVPTPLSKTRDPDLSAIVEATAAIARHRQGELLVVVESTTYPGATRELVLSHLPGAGTFVAFSPERYDPGNPRFGIANTPKIVAGATHEASLLVQELYAGVVDELVPVSSLEVAEMAKLLENSFRAVNIGLVNEFALMARKLGLDPFEVVRAAGTKPFGFLPFEPGPGLGGHCIPVDPHYLSYGLRKLNYEPRFIALADQVNRSMPEHVVSRLSELLAAEQKALSAAAILVYGVAYKAGSNDIRESPALDVIERLVTAGARVEYQDPHVPELPDFGLVSLDEAASFANYDVVVVATAHPELPRARLLEEASLVFDSRGGLGAGAGPARIETL